MPRGHQTSLFGEPSGRGQLFRKSLLRQYLEEHRSTPISDAPEKRELISDWLTSLRKSDATETTLEQLFRERIFTEVLGYTVYPPASGDVATIYPKPSSKLTDLARTPDYVLGNFTQNRYRFDAVLELKSPGQDFDTPQPRAHGETPVEQAFDYGSQIIGVRWVLVSDMRVIRLYSVQSAVEYEEFDLRRCETDSGSATDPLRKLHFLLHHDYLVKGGRDSSTSRLYTKSTADQFRIRDSFYKVYSEIRADFYDEIRAAAKEQQLESSCSRDDLLQATQRLLDRLLFLYYCEDHPDQLIPKDTVEEVTSAALALPGSSGTRVYDTLKELFREIDEGSAETSGLDLYGYNGELFKYHPIIDEIDLPDSLARKTYITQEPDGSMRRISGAYGLHVYDFWSELNEHLLGHIFEESLSDLEALRGVPEEDLAARLAQRKQMGIFYTSSLLSDFLSSRSLEAVLEERTPTISTSEEELAEEMEQRRRELLDLGVTDFACGSGAFLVSAYREMLSEFWRLRSSLELMRDPQGAIPYDMFQQLEAVSQAQLLRQCLYGVDLLPQAVEIAKLALWLRSARKGEAVADLSQNLVVGDSLRIPNIFSAFNAEPGTLDIVLGNPPWGGEMDARSRAAAIEKLGLDEDEEWDSWELFLALGIYSLREGGRLALVLPDSFLYPDKRRSRELVFNSGSLERIMVLGPDWFGPEVRMGSLLIQFRKGTPSDLEFIKATLLAGRLRRQAIEGEIPLTQIEAQRSRLIPATRCRTSDGYQIEPYRGVEDDRIMEAMESASVSLTSVCERGRGEEINKAGLLWICPSCQGPNTPGAKAKGGGYKDSTCNHCGHTMNQAGVSTRKLVRESKPENRKADPYIDGDELGGRYREISPSKWYVTDESGWSYKPSALYAGPKLLIRQAGVGLSVNIDGTNARCPQSVYVYRLTDDALKRGYTPWFLLATLSSRAMNYYVFKKYAEVDPAKAHAKLTHTRLADLPVPKVDPTDKDCISKVNHISQLAEQLVSGSASIGGQEDRKIELDLRALWGLSTDDGAYINREFFDLPDSQVVRELFPDGPPGGADIEVA